MYHRVRRLCKLLAWKAGRMSAEWFIKLIAFNLPFLIKKSMLFLYQFCFCMFGFMVELVRWNLYKGMILRGNKPDDVQFYDCSEAITNTKLKI